MPEGDTIWRTARSLDAALRGRPVTAFLSPVPAHVLERLIATARAQMKRNLVGGPRRTTSALAAEPLWVYRRGGRPCRRCGEPIRRIVQGEQVRSTWWCPGCQREGVPPG